MIGLYCRVSTLAQEAEGYSIQTQIQKGIEFATSQGEPFQIYQETESGTSTENREKYNELIKDIINGKIQKVWVIESSRLNRNLEESIKLQKIFSTYKVQYYVNGVLTSLETAEQKLSYNVQSIVSEYERTKIVERSIRGKSEWQNTGYMALPSLYGYEYKYNEEGKKIWSINEEEAKVIKLIFKLYTEDRLPYNQIKLKLNDEGIKTKKNSVWQNNQIRQVLIQTLYIGQSWKTDGTPIPSKIYTPIIDKEIFDKAQYIIKHTTKTRNKFIARKASNILSGLLRCDICGAPYFANLVQKTDSKGNKKEWYKYYHSVSHTKYINCTNKAKGIDKDKIELIFANLVRDEFFENEDKMWQWWKKYQQKTGLHIDELKKAIEGYKKKKTEIEKKKTKIIESIAEGIFSKQDAKTVMEKYNLQIAEIDVQIVKLKSELNEQETQVNNEAYKAISDLTHNYGELSVNQKRELYKMLFKKILINGNKMLVIMFDDSERKMLIPLLGSRGKRRENIDKAEI